jgi:hypothetical protein
MVLSRLALAVAAVAAAAVPGVAAGGEGVTVELNRIEAVSPDACRLYMVVSNPGDRAWRSLRLDLFAFDKAGVIARRVAVDVAPVTAGKTSVRLFDMAGVPCERVSRVLLNDVIACDPAGEGGAAQPASCTDLVSPRSRVEAVAFDK